MFGKHWFSLSSETQKEQSVTGCTKEDPKGQRSLQQTADYVYMYSVQVKILLLLCQSVVFKLWYTWAPSSGMQGFCCYLSMVTLGLVLVFFYLTEVPSVVLLHVLLYLYLGHAGGTWAPPSGTQRDLIPTGTM